MGSWGQFYGGYRPTLPLQLSSPTNSLCDTPYPFSTPEQTGHRGAEENQPHHNPTPPHPTFGPLLGTGMGKVRHLDAGKLLPFCCQHLSPLHLSLFFLALSWDTCVLPLKSTPPHFVMPWVQRYICKRPHLPGSSPHPQPAILPPPLLHPQGEFSVL